MAGWKASGGCWCPARTGRGSSPRSPASCSSAARTSSSPTSTRPTRRAASSSCASSSRSPGWRSPGELEQRVRADRRAVRHGLALALRRATASASRSSSRATTTACSTCCGAGGAASCDADDRAGGLQPRRPARRRRAASACRSTTSRSRPDASRRPRRAAGAARAARVDLVVLARYMQILSRRLPRPVRRADHQHPPLVPAGLRGRRPYARAHERGVKIIGATAHYVTEDLDAGPDHRAGRRPRHPPRRRRRRSCAPAPTSSGSCSARGPLAPRGSHPRARESHDRLSIVA